MKNIFCFMNAILLTSSVLLARDNEKIEHPDTAKGLIKIEKDGAYIYQTKPLETKHSSQFRIGMIPALDLKSTYVDSTGADVDITFGELYTDAQLPIFMYDYEWQPFTNLGKLGIQVGGGLFTAEGKGRSISTHQPSEERFTFIGLPLNAGFTYRLQLSPRPWLAPYVSAGGTFFAVFEKRDDKSMPKGFGVPGAYGAGGLMFNIAAFSRETAYSLASEYGIGNIWIVAEYRYLKTFSQTLEVSTGFFNAGFSMDF